MISPKDLKTARTYLEGGDRPESVVVWLRKFAFLTETDAKDVVAMAQATIAQEQRTQTAVAVAEEPLVLIWKKPSHKEIDLTTADPVALGLDMFDEHDAKLIDAIELAKHAKLKADPLPLVPPIMKQYAAWVTYESKEKKASVISGTTALASSDKPATQVDYATACENIAQGKGYPNLGFVTDGARTGYLTGVDIDGCKTETGITAKAQAILDFFRPLGAYAEWTPNQGLRVWFRADMSAHKQKKFLLYLTLGFGGKAQKVEVFGDGLYFTVTGDRLPGFTSEAPELPNEQVAKLFELLASLEVEQIKQVRQKVTATRLKLVKQPDGSFKSEPIPPDPAFKKLFDAVGWKPLEDRMRKMQDTRFRGLEVSDKLTFCPMPGHQPRGVDIPYKSVVFGTFDADGDSLAHCFVCGFTGDMVSTVRAFDAGEDGGRIEYETMYDCARAICKEQGLNPDEYFPRKQNTAPLLEPTSGVGIDVEDEEEVVPAFDPSVMNGIAKRFVNLATRGTTLVPQFAFAIANTLIGARIAGRVRFKNFGIEPRRYTSLIGETGSGKGWSWERMLKIFEVPGYLGGSGFKKMDSIDSAAGLKEFFFEPPQNEPVMLFFDEVSDLGNKSGEKRDPGILDLIISLANNTSITRKLAGKRPLKKNDARLSVVACGPSGSAFMMALAGRGKQGATDRFRAEFSVPVEPGKKPDISDADAMQLMVELEELIKATPEVALSTQAEEYLEAFWGTQAKEVQKKVRFKDYLFLDAFMSAFYRGSRFVEMEDAERAGKIFTREVVIRRKEFADEIPDRQGFYAGQIKKITERMQRQLQAGMDPYLVAKSRRDYERETHAYRENDDQFFDRAWKIHEPVHLMKVPVKRANGREYTKFLPIPEDD